MSLAQYFNSRLPNSLSVVELRDVRFAVFTMTEKKLRYWPDLEIVDFANRVIYLTAFIVLLSKISNRVYVDVSRRYSNHNVLAFHLYS